MKPYWVKSSGRVKNRYENNNYTPSSLADRFLLPAEHRLFLVVLPTIIRKGGIQGILLIYTINGKRLCLVPGKGIQADKRTGPYNGLL